LLFESFYAIITYNKFINEWGNLLKKAAVKKEIIKILKYQISGLAVIATDWGIYFMLNSLFGGFTGDLNFRYVAQVFSYTCGAVVSYAINRKWTFSAESKFFSRKIFYYLLLNLASLILSEGVLLLASKTFELHGTLLKEFIAKFIVDTSTAILNYSGIRFWIFREKKETLY